MRSHTAWLFLMVLISSPSYGAPDSAATDWKRVKQVWAELSDAERASYREQIRARAASGETQRAGVADDDCDGTTDNLGPLPFLDSDDTSAYTDQLNLASSGICAGGGNQLAGTGEGPDAIYRVVVDAACSLEVTVTPTSGNDLALYILNGCTDPAGLCIAVQDIGGPGDPETIRYDAELGFVYFVVVDGWAGDAGPYDLQISEDGTAGCSLVPVEVQSFDVE